MHDACWVKVVNGAELVVKDSYDVMLVKFAFAGDKLFDIRLHVLHYDETIMETININLFIIPFLFIFILYKIFELNISSVHLTKGDLCRLKWLVNIFFRFLRYNNIFVENYVNNFWSINVMRHLIEFSQQKYFSKQFSTTIDRGKGIVDKFYSNSLSSWYLSCFCNLTKWSFADFFLYYILVFELVPRINFLIFGRSKLLHVNSKFKIEIKL